MREFHQKSILSGIFPEKLQEARNYIRSITRLAISISNICFCLLKLQEGAQLYA